MNLVERARQKLLLVGADLTQEDYERVTDIRTDAGVILAIHDLEFGGNLRSIPKKSLDFGPFVSNDGGPDVGESDDDEQDGGDENFPAPVVQNDLTCVT